MVEVTRISSNSINQTLLRDVLNIQSNLQEQQDQLSSGFKSRNFAGLGGSVELFTDLKSKVSRIENYSNNITIATTRLNAMNTSFDQVISVADNIKGLMTQWRSQDKNNLNFDQQLSQMRLTISSALNVSVEGRYLFSGTATQTLPVNQDFPASTQPGVPDANYYQGSAQNLTFRAQDDYQFSYNVRADNEAFQNLFAACQLALQANTEQSDVKMSQAMDLLQKGLDGTTALQTQTNVNIIYLKDIQDRQVTLKGYFQGLVDDTVKTDIVEVSTKVAYEQATLQAAYQAFAKINSLKLADFLK